MKAVSPTGVSQWSGFVKATTPAPPDPTHISPTNVNAALPEGSGVVMSRDASAEDADCVTGHEVLRAVEPGDLTTLAGEHLNTDREGGIHLVIDRPVHAPETAGGALAPAVHGDLSRICNPRLTGGKS